MTLQTLAIENDFRAAMRRLASTVSVVTCADKGQWHGMTATAVTSVCADPATVLVCINQSASVHNPLRAGGSFCVNLLTSGQVLVAQAFSGRLTGAARFAVGAWDTHAQVSPALRDAQANLFCTVVDRFCHGTHSIFLGQVDSVRMAGAVSPLIYQDGAYAVATPLSDSCAYA